MHYLSTLGLFEGIGGFARAAQLLGGFRHGQFVEINPYCQRVLAKNFPNVPIRSDIRDYHPTPGGFDVVTGGFPCQDISVANYQGRGLAGERSGLWFEMLRVIQEAQPRFVVIENVPSTLNRNWLGTVLEGLAESGFDAEWQIISAASLGAPHLRQRLFIVAYTNRRRLQRSSAIEVGSGRGNVAGSSQTPTAPHPSEQRSRQCARGFHPHASGCPEATGSGLQSRNLGVDDGLPAWLDGITFGGWWGENAPPQNAGVPSRSVPMRGERIKACGNAVTPQQAAIALGRVLQLSAFH